MICLFKYFVMLEAFLLMLIHDIYMYMVRMHTLRCTDICNSWVRFVVKYVVDSVSRHNMCLS